MKLFDPNGPLMTALGKLADICICNVMFVIFSLPIITAGASLTALHTCMQSLVYDEEDGIIFAAFWRAFRKNFGQATLLWLPGLGAIVFFTAYYFVLSALSGTLAAMYRVTFYLLLLVFLLGYQYSFALQARYKNKVRYTLRNSWLLCVAALPWSMLGVVVPIAFLYVTTFMNPNTYTASIFIWAVCGFGLCVYLDTFFYRMAFRKLTPEMKADRSERPAEAVFTDESRRTDDFMVQQSSFSNPDWNRREAPAPAPQKNKKKTYRQKHL